MLNRHRNLVTPESDFLQVGECTVDVPRREVTAPGREAPVRISLKAQQVLLVLVAHQGKVVGREALLEWVWPDTLPTDDVLTQAIAQLRRAFCDDRESPRYLETIAKGGYRLLAPAQWQGDGVTGISPATDSATEQIVAAGAEKQALVQRRRKQWMLAIGLLVVVACVLVIALRTYKHAQGPSELGEKSAGTAKLAFTSLTSRPGRETDPVLSPDGSMVAYSELLAVADSAGAGENTPRSSVIMAQTTAVAPPRQLTHPEVGESDILPTWSRDGRSLAFIRLGSEACRVMLVSASGEDERPVATCYANGAHYFDWTPDGNALLMGGTSAPDEDRSPLRLLDLATGEWRALKYPVAAGDVDLEPHYSPDGKWIVFRRNFSLSDLWKMPATGGQPKQLSHLKGDIRGWDWTPDGSALIYSFLDSNGAALYRHDLASGGTVRLTGESPAITSPDVASKAGTVVFEIDRGKIGIFRYPADIDRASAGPLQLFASSGNDLLPAVSPDGRRLAFASDRSLRGEWWIGEIDKPESPRPIAGIDPMLRHAPAWSPDGRRLLVIGQVKGRQQLYQVDVESGRVQRLPVSGGVPAFASYLSAQDRLLVGVDGGDGKPELRLYDTSRAPWRVLHTLEGVAFARHDPNTGRIYFTRISQPGLWSVDAGFADEKLVDAELPRPRGYKRWTVTAAGVYFMASDEDCQTGWMRLPMARYGRGRCMDPEREAIGAPVVDPAGKWIYAAVTISDNVDIGWATLPSAASASH